MKLLGYPSQQSEFFGCFFVCLFLFIVVISKCCLKACILFLIIMCQSESYTPGDVPHVYYMCDACVIHVFCVCVLHMQFIHL